MTSEQQNFINKKFKEIDEKLKNINLTEQEKQMLLEERAEYEEQNEEYETICDNDCKNECHNDCGSEYDNECESEDIQYESVYFKYWFEGCKTIDEVLINIEGLKQTFEQWKKEGHELTQPVDTGYCFIDKIYTDS